MKYVALLRGINVGGNNKVDMKRLAAGLSAAGLGDVRTYINSGNIIFSDTGRTNAQLQVLVEKVITKEFGLTIKALVLDEIAFNAVANAIDKTWANDTVMRCDVLFLWEEYDNVSVIEELPAKPDIDTVLFTPGALIWSMDRKNVNKSGLSKIIGTDLYAHMTIRNCNTVRKLQQLLG